MSNPVRVVNGAKNDGTYTVSRKTPGGGWDQVQTGQTCRQAFKTADNIIDAGGEARIAPYCSPYRSNPVQDIPWGTVAAGGVGAFLLVAVLLLVAQGGSQQA